MVLVTRSHKIPLRKPARELPCGKIRILLLNHYLIIFACPTGTGGPSRLGQAGLPDWDRRVCVLIIHGSFMSFYIADQLLLSTNNFAKFNEFYNFRIYSKLFRL